MNIKESIGLVATGRDLLNLIEENDKEAFTAFYSDNFQKLILVANKHLKDVSVAEEIVQDIFLKIWEDREILLNITSIRSYLYRSVVNASINYLNRQRNIEKHHVKMARYISDDDIDLINEQNELIVLLHREIALLPEKCQQVFKLSRLEGLKYKAIAEQLGISDRTVENHMSTALRILRARILAQSSTATPGNKVRYFSLLSTFLY